MSSPQDISPGSPAPAPGTYEEVDVFGKPTGRTVIVRAGDRLPHSARGFSWRLAA